MHASPDTILTGRLYLLERALNQLKERCEEEPENPLAREVLTLIEDVMKP